MHMKLHGWKTVSGLLFTVAIAAVGGGSSGAELGCSTTASAGSSSGSSGSFVVPAGCSADDSLDCSGGGNGISCPSGTTPDDSAGICSDPSDQGDGTDGFCCITIADTGCSQDDTVTGCDYPSYGFSCASGSADPSTDDTTLVCSTATPDPNGNDDYCCVASGSSSGSGSGSSGGDDSSFGTGCVSDDSLDCSAGGTGISCPSGTTPDDSAGACSDPSDQGDGTDGFCCITIADTGCSQDDTVSGCEYPSYGFSCTSGSPDPSTDDSSLNCSTATPDPDGNDDYCCAPM
jgi:hypothetical protein